MKKFSLTGLFNNKPFRIIFSIVTAIIVWAVVAFTISPETSREIKGVQVDLYSSSSVLQTLGLDIIDDVDHKVTVTVEGSRGVLNSLDAHSFTVTPIFSSVTEPGTYELDLIATKNNAMENYNIVSIYPSSITVKLDTAVSKKFTVDTEMIGMSVADGFMVGNITVSPGEVTVIGPEDEVSKIAKVVAVYEVDEVLTKSATYECDLVLYGNDGAEMDGGTVRLDTQTAVVTIPVYKTGILDLDIEFTNVPDGFDVSSVNYVMSRTSIPVAASEANIDNMKTKIVGYVDLAVFSIGESYTFDIELASGFVNLDNVESVTVTFPKENLSSKKLNITDIRLQNAPSNYTITIETQRINDVTVIGPTADVEALSAGSVVAIVDVSQISIDKGTYNVPVSFTVTANNTTWAVGDYTATISVVPN
ncbi:MAG: CdaR family protein [Oscillospiraceae bacterium]|nr:CdaR family protein [Oscillospiraceae bacterium]